jgi:hypothetical protein
MRRSLLQEAPSLITYALRTGLMKPPVLTDTDRNFPKGRRAAVRALPPYGIRPFPAGERPSSRQIVHVVCKAFAVDPAAIATRSRTNPVAHARAAIAVLHLQILGWCDADIATVINRDANTVGHCRLIITRLTNAEPEFRARIDTIVADLRAQSTKSTP